MRTTRSFKQVNSDVARGTSELPKAPDDSHMSVPDMGVVLDRIYRSQGWWQPSTVDGKDVSCLKPKILPVAKSICPDHVESDQVTQALPDNFIMINTEPVTTVPVTLPATDRIVPSTNAIPDQVEPAELEVVNSCPVLDTITLPVNMAALKP